MNKDIWNEPENIKKYTHFAIVAVFKVYPICSTVGGVGISPKWRTIGDALITRIMWYLIFSNFKNQISFKWIFVKNNSRTHFQYFQSTDLINVFVRISKLSYILIISNFILFVLNMDSFACGGWGNYFCVFWLRI